MITALHIILLATAVLFVSCQPRSQIRSSFSDETFREVAFGQNSSPCPKARIISSVGDSQTVTTFLNNEITRWSVETGESLTQWGTHRFDQANDILILPGNTKILMAGGHGVSLHQFDSGQELAAFDDSFTPRNLAYYTLVASSDGRIVASTGIDAWPHKIPDPSGLGFSSEEGNDAQAIQKQKLMLMNLDQKEILGTLSIEDSFIKSLTISNDKRILTTVSYRKISFYDIRDPSRIALIKSIDADSLRPQTSNLPSLFYAASISHDFRLAVISTDEGIYVLNLESQTIETSLNWHINRGMGLIKYLSWSEDNKTIFGSNLQGIVTSWALTSSQLSLQKHYRLDSANGDDLLSSSSSSLPYPLMLVDSQKRFAVVQGLVDQENFGACPGFRILGL